MAQHQNASGSECGPSELPVTALKIITRLSASRAREPDAPERTPRPAPPICRSARCRMSTPRIFHDADDGVTAYLSISPNAHRRTGVPRDRNRKKGSLDQRLHSVSNQVVTHCAIAPQRVSPTLPRCAPVNCLFAPLQIPNYEACSERPKLVAMQPRQALEHSSAF